jgi:cytidine deaminase
LFLVRIFRKGKLESGDIHKWLMELRAHAHIPESGFAVSAVFRTPEDYYFAGVNVENPDHRLATHGEEGAIAAMVTALGKQATIAEGWVMGAGPGTPEDFLPHCCGKCRQQIAAFAAPEAAIHSFSLKGAVETTTVGAFLPNAFTFRDYIRGFAPAPKTAAAPADIEGRLLRKGALAEEEVGAWLKELEPIDYASKTRQAVVLQLDNGSCVAGVRIEDAAFLDISAAQAALAIAAAACGSFKVEKAWAHAGGGKLPLSSLQTLSEFSGGTELPIRYL